MHAWISIGTGTATVSTAQGAGTQLTGSGCDRGRVGDAEATTFARIHLRVGGGGHSEMGPEQRALCPRSRGGRLQGLVPGRARDKATLAVRRPLATCVASVAQFQGAQAGPGVRRWRGQHSALRRRETQAVSQTPASFLGRLHLPAGHRPDHSPGDRGVGPDGAAVGCHWVPNHPASKLHSVRVTVIVTGDPALDLARGLLRPDRRAPLTWGGARTSRPSWVFAVTPPCWRPRVGQTVPFQSPRRWGVGWGQGDGDGVPSFCSALWTRNESASVVTGVAASLPWGRSEPGSLRFGKPPCHAVRVSHSVHTRVPL